MQKKMLLIINPNAGKGINNKKKKSIVSKFQKLGYKVNTIYTKPDYHATQIIKEKLKDIDLVVCCGGDGTLNETINALVTLDLRIPLSFIPLGTMNDFSRTLGMTLKGENFKYIYTDIGKFNNKYFNYVAAFGAFTEVSYITPQKLKKRLGKIAYIVVGIKQLSKIKPYNITINVDNENITGNFIYGAISNSKSVGGFKWYKKNKVQLDDGKFELLLIKKPKNIINFINMVISILMKKYDKPYFVYKKIKKINLKANEQIEWTIDGEYAGKMNDVEIQNIPEKMEYLVLYKK